MSTLQIQDRPTVVCNGHTVVLLHEVWDMPTKCPCCGTAVEKVPNQVAIRCKNPLCEDQVFARLEHAVKKQCLDLDGCGEQTVRELVSRGVYSMRDLFALQDVSFLGDAAAKRFLKGREKAMVAPLWRKLHALGIDGLGITNCKELATRWASLADILDAREEVTKILGPVTAANFFAYVDNQEYMDEIVHMAMLGVTFEEERKTGPLTGKVFVITGESSAGREETIAWIESLGGTVKSSVSKKVHYLVSGPGAGVSKARDANKHGTKVIDEEGLFAMAGQRPSLPKLPEYCE